MGTVVVQQLFLICKFIIIILFIYYLFIIKVAEN